MYQKLTLVGNLGGDPKLRYTPAGSPVCNFSIATNRKRKDGDDIVVWFRITAWGSLAESCNEYLSKGRLVLVEGELVPDTDGHPKVYTRNDDTCGASYELRAHTVTFLGGRQEAEAEQEAEPEPEQEQLPF